MAQVLLTKDALQAVEAGDKWYQLSWRDRGSLSGQWEDGPNGKHHKAFFYDCRNLLGTRDFPEWLNIQARHTLRMGHWADIASLLGESSESFPDELSRVLNHCDKSRFLLLEKELGKRSPHCVIDLLIQHAPEYVGSFGPVHGQTLLHTAVTHDNKKALLSIITVADPSNEATALSQCDKHGCLPLHVAVMARASLGLLMLLIDLYPAALWTCDNNG